MLPDITTQKVAVPAALFLALSPRKGLDVKIAAPWSNQNQSSTASFGAKQKQTHHFLTRHRERFTIPLKLN